jgi:hypothetical protein
LGARLQEENRQQEKKIRIGSDGTAQDARFILKDRIFRGD